MLGFPSGSIVKNPPANAGDGVQTPGQEYPLENEIAAYSSVLAWEIPWTEEHGGLQSRGSQKSWTRPSNKTTTASKHVVYWTTVTSYFLKVERD